MTAAIPTDIIIQRCHDKKWQYPKPVENLDEWVSSNTDDFDPQFAHRMYWPDRPYQTGMEILVVDGGTTQAPVIARTNPDAKVTATVHTKGSLDHAVYLKHKNRLGNLELRILPIDELAALNQSFDLVIASGVLQQAGYTEARLGMKAVAQMLKPEGVAAFLLYSRYLPSNPQAGYEPDATDSFVHSNGVYLSVQDCLDLVEGAGLAFQDWMVKSPYYLPALASSGNEFLKSINELPDRQMWSVMEPLRNNSGRQVFTACRTDRRPDTYRIDFTSPRVPSYVPAWRRNAGLDGRHAVRPGWTMSLNRTHLELAEKIDGSSSIRQIAGQPDLEDVTSALVQELWRMDFVTISLA